MKKSISTEQTPENIQEILRLLAETPLELDRLSAGLSEAQRHEPLAEGERSFHQVLAHLIHRESRTFEMFALALSKPEPVFTSLHPERDFGKLYQFERLPFPDLLAYFKLRRAVLLPVLTSLTDKKWGRVVQEAGKLRKESVYWQARGLALHELDHLQDLEKKLVR